MSYENTVSSSSKLYHLFIADSLQLTYLTSRFGGTESFATSISLEKLHRFVSSSCPYFWRQFSAILAASQLYFVDILIIGYNIKGSSKSFSLQSALCSSYKAFQSGDRRSMTKNRLKSFIAQARCIL